MPIKFFPVYPPPGRVKETGQKEKGGDGTAARIRDFLEKSGYRVFLDVGMLEGAGTSGAWERTARPPGP